MAPIDKLYDIDLMLLKGVAHWCAIIAPWPMNTNNWGY